MPAIILHHYAGSMFSEKVRLLLGYKGARWQSVTITPIMPRPLLMPLTGGYRRTPVMQIGADVYCDTRMIVERLEVEFPERSVLPSDRRCNITVLADWADTHLFQLSVATCFQPRAVAAMMGSLPAAQAAAFAEDRARLAEGATGLPSMAPGDAEAQLIHWLVRLDSQLAEQGPYLFGDAPVVADFSVYHCLWLVAANPAVAPLLEPFASVREWMGLLAAIGHGDRVDITGEEALAQARAAQPTRDGRAAWLPDGIRLGMAVQVTPLDYGRIPVHGRLVSCTDTAFALLREAPETGEVTVHFPRAGFAIAPGSPAA